MAEPARQAIEAESTVPLDSRRFGRFEIPADRVLLFPEGLVGFPEAQRFALLEPSRTGSPFRWLVCLDFPELGFVVCDPTALWPGYAADLALPAGCRPEDLGVLAIVTVPTNPSETTANLMAPLVLDCRTRLGQQLVLDTGRYSTRHPVLAPSDATGQG